MRFLWRIAARFFLHHVGCPGVSLDCASHMPFSRNDLYEISKGENDRVTSALDVAVLMPEKSRQCEIKVFVTGV